MRKLFDGTYKRLDDEVSFQILRTNPRLTANVKLMYNGEDMYLESYSANDLLSTKTYKNKRIWRTGLYNNDVKNFLKGTNSSAFVVGSKMSDTVIGNDYANQYENMYWSGAEAITSSVYSEELGIVAPLYLRKKIPNYFVVFKIDGPSNFTMTKDDNGNIIDNEYNFNEDILAKATIIKSFDLREGTVIGDYLRRYTSQKNFEFDKSMYVNFSTNEIYYYGIDIDNGLLTKKVNNFKEELMDNDNTILHSDDWFTNGYCRNNLVFPYIINFEFVFDDNEADEYTFCRYFGYYCDDIDLYEFNKDDDKCVINKNYHYYLKDKYNDLHYAEKFVINEYKDITYFYQSAHYNHYIEDKDYVSEYDFSLNNTDFKTFNLNSKNLETKYDEIGFGDYSFKSDEKYIYINECSLAMFKKPECTNNIFYNPNESIMDHEINKNNICISDKIVNESYFGGYKPKTISAYCNYEDGVGYVSFTFSIDKVLSHGDSFRLCYSKNEDEEWEDVSFYAEEIEGVYDEEYGAIYVYSDAIYDEDNNIIQPEIDMVVDDNNKPIFKYDGEISSDKENELSLYKSINVNIIKTSYNKDDITIENDFCAVITNKSTKVQKVLERKYKYKDADAIVKNRFSCTGNTIDIATNICNCINSYSNEYNIYRATNYNNIVVIKFTKYGSEYNDKITIEFSDTIETNSKVTKYSMNNTNSFTGGTDIEGCIFKVRTDEINYFIGEGNQRYIRTPEGFDDAKIESYGYTIDEFGDIDNEYFTITTDSNGQYIKISDVKQVEILDKFYPTFGLLSFYPVKDFDFDSFYSSYCDDSLFSDELTNFSSNLDLSEYYDDGDYDDSDDETLKQEVLSNHIKIGRLFNDNKIKLENEYEYFFENIIPELCTISKSTGHIVKWGYVDGMDSCENQYRLNCSKIFGVDNLSANLFLHDGNKFNFTHDMPYYICDKKRDIKLSNKEYQYIPVSGNFDSVYENTVNKWIYIFENEEINYFDKYFRDTTSNKRHSRKYSKFKYGNTSQKPNTLFRGVKFDICGIVDNNGYDKEVVSAKYNDYDFSFIYIPCYNSTTLYFNNDIYFVKNDKFKFIVGFIVVNIFSTEHSMNKILMYSACNNLVKFKDTNENLFNIFENVLTINMKFEDVFSCKINNNLYYLDKMLVISPLLKVIIDCIRKKENTCNISNVYIKTNNNSNSYDKYFTYENGYNERGHLKHEITLDGYYIYLNSFFNGHILVKDPGEDIEVSISIKLDKNKYNGDIRSYIISEISTIYNNISAYNIKTAINDNFKYSIHYNTDDFKISVIEPSSIDSMDYFEGNVISNASNGLSVVTSAEVSIKSSVNNMYLRKLNRYSGYYQPIFKDILFFDDMKYNDDNYLIYSNTSFNSIYSDNEGSFGIINNMYFHKINEDYGNTLLTSIEPYYPLTGEYALDWDDYNVYSSNWDMGYYTKQKDIYYTQKCNYIACIDDELCMFGSKYMNVPERIEFEMFQGCEEWDDNYAMNPDACDGEALYREVDNNYVEYCLFITKRFERYLCNDISNIRDEISKYVSSEYSYGLKNTIEDDITEYVRNNILDLYQIEKIKMYVKSVKRGVNDTDIENDYTKYLNGYTIDYLTKYEGFEENTSFKVSSVNYKELDKKITYSLKNGTQEYFAFKICLIKK